MQIKDKNMLNIIKFNELRNTLKSATSSTNQKTSAYSGAINYYKSTQEALKESISKNKELALKITESQSEIVALQQELPNAIQEKKTLVSNMNDEQKAFILDKARTDKNEVIIQLIMDYGFDEEDYQNQQEAFNVIDILTYIENDEEVDLLGDDLLS
jgi:predicted nuclease with TOPRIM domain